jgi:hypothetical protein
LLPGRPLPDHLTSEVRPHLRLTPACRGRRTGSPCQTPGRCTPRPISPTCSNASTAAS